MTADRAGWAEAAPRMRDVSHVHPEHDPRGWHWFARGPFLVADGGRAGDDRDGADGRGREGDDDRGRHRRDVEDEQLRDVSHTPAHGEGANRVWDRGEPDDEDEGG